MKSETTLYKISIHTLLPGENAEKSMNINLRTESDLPNVGGNVEDKRASAAGSLEPELHITNNNSLQHHATVLIGIKNRWPK